MAPSVTVDPATPSERVLIEGLFQFYIYDSAEMYGDKEGFDLGPDGRFKPYPYLEAYWEELDRRPFVIRRDGRTAGFALLNTFSHRSSAIDNAIAEFFVMRAFRRSGVGATAARALFMGYPGRWELAISAANLGARHFWPTVVASTPGVADLQTIDLDATFKFRRVLAFTVEPCDPR